MESEIGSDLLLVSCDPCLWNQTIWSPPYTYGMGAQSLIRNVNCYYFD